MEHLRKVRLAKEEDIPFIMPVFQEAREKMQASGNRRQWTGGYPSEAKVLEDIRQNGAFVVEEKESIVAYFAFLPSPEPTYGKIVGGKWLDDRSSYHVVHRIAARHGVHGIFSLMLEYAFSLDANIRIDTHRDNVIMQHLLQKHGFSYCGVIYLLSGDERLAYQKIIK